MIYPPPYYHRDPCCCPRTRRSEWVLDIVDMGLLVYLFAVALFIYGVFR